MDLDRIIQALRDVDPVVWVVVAVVVVVVLLAVAIMASVRRRRRRRALQERYGPEYDRTRRRAGSKRRADHELLEREERRRSYEVRDLDPSERERLRARWEALQAGFVDGPETTLRAADELIAEVAASKGYPTEDRDPLADVGLDHPLLVDRYRAAMPDEQGDDERPPTTEQLRRGMLAARDLFEAMVGREPTDTGEGSQAFLDLVAEEREEAEHRAPEQGADTGREEASPRTGGDDEADTDMPLYGPDGRRLDVEAGDRRR